MTNKLENRRNLEESIIGAALVCGTFKDIDLMPNEFCFDNTRAVFQSAKELEASNQAIDPVTIAAASGSIAVSEISRLLMVVPTGKNLPHYLEQLKKSIYEDKAAVAKKKAAKLISESEDPEPIARQLTAELDQLAARYLPAKRNNRFQEACLTLINNIDTRKAVEGFFKSGLTVLDDLLVGFCPPEYTIIAARPSVGKTAICLNILASMARNGLRSSFFSLEMSGNPVAARMLAMLSGTNTKLALRAPDQINPQLRERMLNSATDLLMISEWISLHDEPGQTIKSICQKARKEVRENGSQLLIVDHIQHCKGEGRDRRLEVENISLTFQDLLKELNVPGIMLSQINRKIEGENRRPTMSDLKESGAIEQHADNIVFLHKPKGGERENGYLLELLKSKGRNTGTGFSQAFFNTDHQVFQNA